MMLWTIFIYFSLFQKALSSLNDVTGDVGLAGNRDGVLAAFGDFNSDKKADLFVISNSKTKAGQDHGSIHIYFWDGDDEEFKKDGKAKIQIKNSFITNVIPGDFNSDGHLDALVAYYNSTHGENDTFVKLFLGWKSQFESNEITLEDIFLDQPAIVDFNGDLQPDLLGEKKSDKKRYWWSYNDKNRTFQSNLIPTKGLLPLSKPHSCGFLDLNGDYTPDLFIPTSKKGNSLDVVFEVWINEEGSFNLSHGPSLTYVYKPDVNKPEETIIGQSTFADLDSDGIADHLLPVCERDCKIRVYSEAEKKVWNRMIRQMIRGGYARKNPDDESDFALKISNAELFRIAGTPPLADYIKKQQLLYAGHVTRMRNDSWQKISMCMVNKQGGGRSCLRKYGEDLGGIEWVTVLSETNSDFKWKFIKGTNKDKIPFMTLRIGDYNLDGYPDVAAIIEAEQEKKQMVVLFENVKCRESSADCFHGRKLSMVFDSAYSSIHNPIIVGFFDLYENGILDLFVASSNDTAGTYKIRAIKNSVFSDTCFLKVIVLGGSCFSDCPNGITPYGVNQAGPFVKYVTTGPDGDTKQASATQLSQAAYYALQPPYIVFGLGRTPNFVEKLIIGLPRSMNSPVRRRTWTSIIPNSQVIIIPYPPDDPDEWKSKLLMTPSRLVLLTGGALLATCVFIGGIVALLHWKEKREDRREKQEAAHKFHFDAM